MNAFYIGQPVRVARNVGAAKFDYLIGYTGNIVALDQEGLNCADTCIELNNMPFVVFHPSELEPVIPPNSLIKDELRELEKV